MRLGINFSEVEKPLESPEKGDTHFQLHIGNPSSTTSHHSKEATYGGFVSAVQVNFHCNGESFHDQHRDVYSAKQRAGPNCACSFKECVGTVCYLVVLQGQVTRVLERTLSHWMSAKPGWGDNLRNTMVDGWLR